jgi:hypothetical protein
MRVLFCFDRLALMVEDVDFLNPKIADKPDVRERGARIELRPVETADAEGASIYASQHVAAGLGRCRLDFLESAPYAADRMHWHPAMAGGEPEERTFDRELSADPVGWLRARLADGERFLRDAGVADTGAYAADVRAMAAAADDVVAQVERVLARARQPWPEVAGRDVRGMAA